MRAPLALLSVALLLAGCSTPTSPAPGLTGDGAPGGAGGPLALDVTATGCSEGGAHSNYPLTGAGDEYLPEPWLLADVAEDLGNPAVGTEGVILPGSRQWGIYHATVTCETWRIGEAEGTGLAYGFVGVRVEPPPFDTGGATRHVLVVHLTTSVAPLLNALASVGVHASRGETSVELVEGFFRGALKDEHHGVYDSLFKVKEAGAMDAGVTRVWLLHEEAGRYRPLSLDFVDSGRGLHLVADGRGFLSHSGTADHPPLPAVAGQMAGLAYLGFDRAIRLGPAPDVLLDEAWTHSGVL